MRRVEDRGEGPTRTHPLALTVNLTEQVEIGVETFPWLAPFRFLKLRAHPVRRALQHRHRNVVFRIEMMVEARFADPDFIGDILKAEAVEAARLREALSRIQNSFSCIHTTYCKVV